MALTLSQQAELSENALFQKRVKQAFLMRAHDEWYSINRAPVGTDPEPQEGNMTNKDALVFNYAVAVINNPDNYAERFTRSAVQDAQVKDGAWTDWLEDSQGGTITLDVWQEQIPDNPTLLSVANALFVRFTGASQWGIANNA